MRTIENLKLLFLRTTHNSRGQLALPAIMCVPIVLLLIYLLMETTKLSTVKIRHQFALDTAAYTEMTFPIAVLNAHASLNGSVPYRVFIQVFNDAGDENMIIKLNDENPDTDKNLPAPIMMYEFMYNAGAFVGTDKPEQDTNPDADKKRWDLKHKDGTRKQWQTDSPKEYTNDPEPLSLIDNETWSVNADYLVTEQKALAATMWYILIADLLEGAARGFEDELQRAREKAELFRKSYYYNTRTGREADAGREGASYIKKYSNITTTPMYIKDQIKMPWVEPQYGSDQWDILGRYWGARSVDIDIKEITENEIMKSVKSKDKIYQFSYLTQSTKSLLRELANSVTIEQKFKLDKNYFNVNLNKYNPRVRVSVQVMCPDEKNNCVWPKPTPNYQVRLLP